MLRLSHLAASAVLGFSLVVGGCSHERHEEIPTTAMMAVEGDERLSYTAPHDGKVYVYDVNDDRMLYSGDVKEGDAVTVDPEKSLILIEGRTAMEDGVRDGHRHRVFFDEAEPSDTSKTVIKEETTIQRAE